MPDIETECRKIDFSRIKSCPKIGKNKTGNNRWEEMGSSQDYFTKSIAPETISVSNK
jgi:hypothetical protein